MQTFTPPIPARHAGAEAAKLLRDGFLIIENAIAPADLERACDDLEPCFAAAPFSDGLFYGHTTKRFGRLLIRLSDPAAWALNARILPIVAEILGPQSGVQLNLTQAIEIHPGAPVQVPHRDHDMWGCAKTHGTTYMVNVMWPLDDFTADNGATRIWQGTNNADWSVMLPEEDKAVSAVAPAGSAILFLGQTLHSGGANRSTSPRRGMIFSYCLDWLLPDENPWLAYPPFAARDFPTELARLVGYRQRFAGLNNYEGRDPIALLGEPLPDFLRFTDDMSPEQDDLIRGYYDTLGEHEAA